jgi:hypothetical protein
MRSMFQFWKAIFRCYKIFEKHIFSMPHQTDFVNGKSNKMLTQKMFKNYMHTDNWKNGGESLILYYTLISAVESYF